MYRPRAAASDRKICWDLMSGEMTARRGARPAAVRESLEVANRIAGLLVVCVAHHTGIRIGARREILQTEVLGAVLQHSEVEDVDDAAGARWRETRGARLCDE